MGILTEDLTLTGNITLPSSCITNDNISASAAITRSRLAQDDLKAYPVPLVTGRTWDAIQTVLPTPTPANDDLGITVGTWGTNPVYLSTGDVGGLGAKNFYAVYEIPLPAEYVDAQTVNIRVSAGMQTTVSDGACTVDITCYEATGASATGISADLCTTAAQDMKNLTAANKDFTITATDLVAGDMLNIRLHIAVTDAATEPAVIANIYSLKLLCDVKG